MLGRGDRSSREHFRTEAVSVGHRPNTRRKGLHNSIVTRIDPSQSSECVSINQRFMLDEGLELR